MAKRNIVITGGAGFIGSHVVRLFVNKYPGYNIINLDKLTYAGNLANLKDVEDKPNYKFVRMDICNLAAWSKAKVPITLVRANVNGSLILRSTWLSAAKWMIPSICSSRIN